MVDPFLFAIRPKTIKKVYEAVPMTDSSGSDPELTTELPPPVPLESYEAECLGLQAMKIKPVENKIEIVKVTLCTLYSIFV